MQRVDDPVLATEREAKCAISLLTALWKQVASAETFPVTDQDIDVLITTTSSKVCIRLDLTLQESQKQFDADVILDDTNNRKKV